MTQTINLNRYAAGIADYIVRMNQDNETLESAVNLLLATLTGQSIAGLDVPRGLQQIFDRKGLIGAGSYALTFSPGTSHVNVAAGAYWSGSVFYARTSVLVLDAAGKAAGTYYLNLDATGTPLIAATPDDTTCWQFDYNGGTTFSNVARYTGVGILFDGDDYAAMLTSAARAKSFTKVADRLEEIEVLLGKTVQTLIPANTINVNCALGNHIRVLLNRPTTTFAFAGGYDGQRIVLELTQDEEGGREVAFGAEVVSGSDLTMPVALSTDPNKSDELGFIYHLPTAKYRYTSLARGF